MKAKELLSGLLLLFTVALQAQTVDGNYVKQLYEKYPTQKTDFCASCKLWVNPYYKSIADTARHMPLLTFYIYTKAHRLQQETSGPKREGIYSAWHAAYVQKSETAVYTEANRIVQQSNRPGEIQKGHCQAWILLAYTGDGSILSDTYTFNSAMEYRGQNLGTEIESEERCRKLTGFEGNPEVTDSIRIWCGTFGSQRTFTKGSVTNTVPEFYYKIIQYFDHIQHQQVQECYWMPNQPEETRDKLPLRKVDFAVLKSNLGFDPQSIFN